MTKDDWRGQFRPLAHKLAEKKTDEELAQLLLDCDQRSETNCWWAVYEVVPLVKAEVRVAMFARDRARLAQTDQNSVAGTTTLAPPESG